MVKVDKLLSTCQQLCFAHCIQLTVVDVLYKKWCDSNLEINTPFESDIKDFEETDNCDEILAIIKSDNLSKI